MVRRSVKPLSFKRSNRALTVSIDSPEIMSSFVTGHLYHKLKEGLALPFHQVEQLSSLKAEINQHPDEFSPSSPKTSLPATNPKPKVHERGEAD